MLRAGIAVVSVMVITTCMVTLIMLVIWKTSIWLIALFFVVFGFIEMTYLSAVMYKFTQGGYLPLVFALVLTTIMGIWHYVHKKKYMFELTNKVSSDYIKDLATNRNINRVPGIGLLYAELVQGIPPIFPHFVTHIPSIHSVLVFVSIKSIPISKVELEERFLFRRVEPRDYRMFRCVVRYGYNDVIGEPKEFEQQLVEQLKEFIRIYGNFDIEAAAGHDDQQQTAACTTTTDQPAMDVQQCSRYGKAALRGSARSVSAVHMEESILGVDASSSSSSIRSSNNINGAAAAGTNSQRSARSAKSFSNRIVCAPLQGAEEEMQFVQQAKENGLVYLLGETQVVAEPNSSFLKKMVVNYAYNFLRNNFRQGEEVMAIPRARLLRVGMTYEI